MWWRTRSRLTRPSLELAQPKVRLSLGHTYCQSRRCISTWPLNGLHVVAARSSLAPYTRDGILRRPHNLFNVLNRNGSALARRTMENRYSISLLANHTRPHHGTCRALSRPLSLKEKPTSHSSPSTAAQKEESELEKNGFYRCKRCNTPVAKQGSECGIGQQGARSLQINPHGYLHKVLTVHSAFNILLYGSPVAADSWFPGYLWRFCLCTTCTAHIGWSYHLPDKDAYDFIGLRREAIMKD